MLHVEILIWLLSFKLNLGLFCLPLSLPLSVLPLGTWPNIRMRILLTRHRKRGKKKAIYIWRTPPGLCTPTRKYISFNNISKSLPQFCKVKAGCLVVVEQQLTKDKLYVGTILLFMCECFFTSYHRRSIAEFPIYISPEVIS